MTERAGERYTAPTIGGVKEALLALGEALCEAEAIGLVGSLARGTDFTERSDIDVFVVLQETQPGFTTDYVWHRRVSHALARFGRDVTLLIYTLRDLKAIPSWYTLRMAAEAVLLFDRGGVEDLFHRIIRAAEQAGLVRKPVDGTWVWSTPADFQAGQVIRVQLDDAE